MASTDDKRPPAALETSPAVPADAARGDRRRHAHEVLSNQRHHLDRLENELSQGFRTLEESLARSLAEDRAGESPTIDLAPQLEEVGRQLAAERAELERQRTGWEQARIELGRLEQELRVRDVLLREAQTQQEQRVAELATARDQLVEARTQATCASERHDTLRRELTELQHQSSTLEEETAAQRRRIARQFKIQHAEHLAELDRRKSELDALAQSHDQQLELQVSAAQAEARKARDESVTARDEAAQARGALAANNLELLAANQRAASLQTEVDQVRQELEALRATPAAPVKSEEDIQRAEAAAAELARAKEQVAALTDEITALRAALEAARAEGANIADQLDRSAAHQGAEHAQLTKVEQQRDELAAKLAAAESQLRAAAAKPGKTDELERRLQMALDEVHEQKRANAELEGKLAKAKTSGTSAPAAASGGLDWEAQKQRLLASLAADESDDEEAVAERHSIESTIRITDEMIAKKDLEIAELKLQVEKAGSEPALGEATTNILDADETIRKERERLAQLQAEWREKIGKAETEISIERARIARERAELAEKMQLYGQQQPRNAAAPGEPAEPKPARGRWLTMLGLKEVEGKPEE